MHSERPTRLLHTMLRVRDLERSLAFYEGQLGMTVLRKERYPDGRFTLAFVGYDTGPASASIELTHNWDRDGYDIGSAYGHVALAVRDVRATCLALAAAGVTVIRAAGPMTAMSPDRRDAEVIAFIEDPDGYRIELVERRD